MNFKQITPEFEKEFWNLVEKEDNISITGHISIDDDSIASTLAVYKILTDKYPNKNIEIIYTDQPTNKFAMFENFSKIDFVDDINNKIKQGALLIMLDGSQYSRFSHQPKKLREKVGKSICIDHHKSPIQQFDLSLIDTNSPSCAEIIYKIFSADKKISKQLAEIYLLGILGDTGNFSYLKPNQSETLLIAKKLIETADIEIQEFQARYSTISKRVFEIVRELIKNTQYHQIQGWPNFQTSYITKKFKQSKKYTDSEISDGSHIYGSHYLRVIENYTWGFTIYPTLNNQSSISLRSLPKSVNVRKIVENIGIGGGHDRAAGGEFKSKDVKKCIQQILDWINNNKPVIS